MGREDYNTLRYKTTYLLIPPPYLARIFISLQRCHDDSPGACVLITDRLRHHLAL